MDRGNEPASVPVGRHFVVASALLALGALAWLAEPRGVRGVPRAAPLVLAGLTLVFEGIAFWYMPSFAKRHVEPVAVAAWAGPILFPAAFILAELGLGAPARVALAAALASLPLVLLWRGRPWRGGVPFWRVEGDYQNGDRAAMLSFALASGLLLVAAALALLQRDAEPTWLVALALLVLGGLLHLLPRNRQAPLPRVMPIVGVSMLAAGAVALVAGASFWGGFLLGAGALVAIGNLAQPKPAPARRAPGARLRDARWPLGAAAIVAAATGALVGFGLPDIARSLLLGFPLGLVAVGLALAGLTLLVVPVMFNQIPRRDLVPPASVAALLGGALLAAAQFAPSPALSWAARLALPLGLALFLAAMEPLRRPRRDCEPS